MKDILTTILLAPVGVLLYGSGLLLWPTRRWHRRKQLRGKALGFVLLGPLVAYLAVAAGSVFIQLEHFSSVCNRQSMS